MSAGRSASALLIIFALALVLAACGGGGGESTTSAGDERTPSQEKAMAKAEANCRLMLREVREAAHGVLSRGYENNLKLVTLGFGRPGLKVARRTRARQQKLVDALDDKAFETYVGLFDPIILFARQSMEAATREDLITVTNLKEKLTTLGTEQSVVAAEAGLPACEVNFLNAMVRAATQ